jgi:pseudaminic acid synthase
LKTQVGVSNMFDPHSGPTIVAELSGNHAGSLQTALELVEAAASAGAGAIKLQTYKPETMTLDLRHGDFVINDPNSLWNGEALYTLYEKAHTPWEWHEPIMNRAAERGLICFSSPFDESAVDFLESLEVPAYKIASFENVDLPLIAKAASTGKPLIISTGIASVSEINEAVETARKSGCEQLMLLKCTSSYPARAEEANLLTIPHMREMFRCEVGLSDHTLGIGVALAATALGATLIEKHFTLDVEDGAVDSKFSMDPPQLRALVEESQRVWASLGTVHYGPTESERGAHSRRRSLYIGEALRKGERINESNLRRVRPGLGLSPKFYPMLLGAKVTRDVDAGTPVTWDLFGMAGPGD